MCTYTHIIHICTFWIQAEDSLAQTFSSVQSPLHLFSTTLILNIDTSPCSEEEALCPLGTALTTPVERCIPGSFVCDGVEDCIGGTDEEDCLGKDCI